MKKNKWFNRKILFTITLFFVLFCFIATSSWAARKVELTSDTKHNFVKKLNEGKKYGSKDIAAVFGLTENENLNLVRSRVDFNRITHYRYQQTYMDIPVWGMDTVVSIGPSDNVVRLHGTLALDIPDDVKGIPKTLDPEGALREMKEKHKGKDKKAVWNFENETYGTYIYVDKKNKAYLCYAVSFFADNENGNPSRTVYLINAKTGKVLHSYENLQHADGVGPGGNLKIGYYYYGTDYPPFGVAANGSTCTMDFGDVKSVNLNHGTSGSTAYSYTCYENTFKEINGAYSPINDAQYFGQVVYDMYQAWYGVPVLPFQLMMRVHYSTNYENAFWNGSSMTFGDGYTTFHPLVCLDVSAHEVAHGFTENHSGLIYSSQSGGINEAYSDMAGEAAEYYSRGDNDFMCGYDIFKAAGQALRYLYDPPLDGISIDHVNDYYEGMDVHYSSGIFNKAFYLIAVSPGWDTRKAFDIFTKANMDYWTPGTTFQQGADGALDAALDYGYNCQDVVNAFATVGIPLTCPGPPVAEFSGTPTSGGTPLTVIFTDLSTNNPTSWSWSFPGGTPSSSTQQNPTVVYNTAGTYDVTLTATNAGGSDGETKTNYITVQAAPPGVTFESGTVSGVSSSSWQSVTLANTYTSPVVVCSTGIANSSDLPVAVRVRNASGNSFDVRVQNPSGTALSGHTVHYVVVEEGVYTAANDGVTMEAVKVNSTITTSQGSWTLEPRSYQNTYTNPVVVGQVMTANDVGWSVFWASSSRTSPPTASTLNAGKEVGEDTNKTRNNETIGYIVIEQGSGTINGIPYTAAVGADTVRGPANTSTGYTYNFTSVGTASAAIVSTAGMDGGNGGWPVMYGSNPYTASSITLVVDEDQIADSERSHTTEQVAYIVFGQ